MYMGLYGTHIGLPRGSRRAPHQSSLVFLRPEALFSETEKEKKLPSNKKSLV